jgi:hypothetical protein
MQLISSGKTFRVPKQYLCDFYVNTENASLFGYTDTP